MNSNGSNRQWPLTNTANLFEYMNSCEKTPLGCRSRFNSALEMVQCYKRFNWLKDSEIKAGDSKARVIANKKTQSETEALEQQHNLSKVSKI